MAEKDTTEQPTVAAALAMMAELFKEMQSGNSAASQERALNEAQRLLLEQQRFELEKDRESRNMPENKTHSGLSVYWPDPSIPKPTLKCLMYWLGYDIQADTHTPEEIVALNTLEPGEFRVTKADGKVIPFKVTAKYQDAIDPATNRPKVEGLSVWFPHKGDDRQNHLSLMSYCRQATGGALPNTADLLAEVERLKRELMQEKQRSVMTAV